MRRLGLIVVVLLCASDGLLVAQRDARPRRDRTPATGTGVIRGRVVAAGSGAPVRHAAVQASLQGDRPRAALTAADGTFELRSLPAGTWTVRAAKTGFVAQTFGQRTPFSAAGRITLEDGQQFTADFALVRGSVITGRIVDEFGDPLAGARVNALRVQVTPFGPRLVPTGVNVVTDDTGAYRLYGLSPGEYFVAAAPTSPALLGNLETTDGHVTYAASYFPGTADVSAAQRVTVAAGQEQHSISFGVSPVPAARVSGTVIGSSGAPIDGMVTLQSPFVTEALGGRGRTGTSAAGAFTLTNVPPGSYLLEVTERVRSRDDVPEVAVLPITVAGADITGLTVTTSRGARMSGTVVSSDGTLLSTAGMRVTAQRMRVGPGGFSPRAELTATGSFELEGLVGLYSIRIEQLPNGWAVKSITVNGADITDAPIDFRGTEQVTARVVLTQRLTQLTGTVTSSDLPLRGSSVLVFPDDEAKWTATSRYVKTTRLDDKGEFSIAALPPHTRYVAIALEYLEAGEQLDPEFLRSLKDAATPFALAKGQPAALSLRLVRR